MDATQTGLLIKESRMKREMTQQALADALNVSATAISKWENGHSLPDITMLEPLSTILDISITDLVLGKRSNNNMSDNISKVLSLHRKPLELRRIKLSFLIFQFDFLKKDHHLF